MLSQVNHWMEIAAVVIDGVLLLRILQLRLQRTYLFITLACVLSLIFDGSSLWLGNGSRESVRVFLYSRFIYALVFPAAAYDVWEEAKKQLARIRRFATFRLIASLTLAALLGFLISSFSAREDDSSESLFDTFAVILWAATSTASLAFLWSMARIARAQKVSLPGNTAVWLVYYQLLLAEEVLVCFLIIVGGRFSTTVTDALDISLSAYLFFITAWCIWRLRGSPSDVPSAPENANL